MSSLPASSTSASSHRAGSGPHRAGAAARRSASTACCAGSAKARRARSSSPRRLPRAATSRSSGCAPARSPTRRTARYYERFFAAEAALVGRLQHPNVVQIFDAVADPAEPYLVMEYVAGSTLRPLLPRRPAAVAGADRRTRLQVRDGARLRVPPGPDPPRREAGQPAGGARPTGSITDVKVTDFGSVLNTALRRDAGLPRRLAGLHVARAARRQRRSTAAPTSIRSAPCCTT